MRMQWLMLQAVPGIFSGTYAGMSAFIAAYGYAALFILMFLESIGVPIPSEIMLPVAGHLIYTGAFASVPTFAIVTVSSILGIAFDYFLAYFLGRKAIYGHLRWFRIRKESMDSFEKWFEENGTFAVFVGQFIPEVRALISLPAGVARMQKKRFFPAAIIGSAIWNASLLLFGYYALATTNLTYVAAAVTVFVIILYMIYRHFTKKILKK